MAQAVSCPNLRSAINKHLGETKDQISRLDSVFKILGKQKKSETCEAMRGLMEEMAELLSASGDPKVKDAVIIGALQRVEHYEMAGYGTTRAFAKQLGQDEIASLLQETLDEEGATNKALTSLAEGGIFSNGLNEAATGNSATM